MTPPDIEATLVELGYSDKILQGATSQTDYSFEIPAGWRLSDGDASVELNFSHSQLIDYNNSSLRVMFNNYPLAETMLTEDSALNGNIKVDLPSTQAKTGRLNKITVQARLEALSSCTALDSNWLTLNGKSMLNLIYRKQDVENPGFDTYPLPFNQQPDLTNLMFVLPETPIFDEWRQAIRISATIGQGAEGSILAPKLFLGDNWSPDMLNNHHIVAIGRPSRNTLLQAINHVLLQPFVPGSDMLEQKLNDVVLHTLPGTSLGILQITRGPEDGKHGLLAVTGTTDEGVAWAGDALRRRFVKLNKGNLAFIQEEQVTTIDTNLLTNSGAREAIATSVPGFTEVDEDVIESIEEDTTGMPTATETLDDNRPRWLIASVGLAAVLVIATLALAYWQNQRREMTDL
jgi:hypothetical protein